MKDKPFVLVMTEKMWLQARKSGIIKFSDKKMDEAKKTGFLGTHKFGPRAIGLGPFMQTNGEFLCCVDTKFPELKEGI